MRPSDSEPPSDLANPSMSSRPARFSSSSDHVECQLAQLRSLAPGEEAETLGSAVFERASEDVVFSWSHRRSAEPIGELHVVAVDVEHILAGVASPPIRRPERRFNPPVSRNAGREASPTLSPSS